MIHGFKWPLICKLFGHRLTITRGLTVTYWQHNPNGECEHVYKHFSNYEHVSCDRCFAPMGSDKVNIFLDKADEEVRTPYTEEMKVMNALQQVEYGPRTKEA